MGEASKITVVGAGIVGVATASYLQRDGWPVTLIDMRPPGEYCSSGNAGILSPASCVPFGLPGLLGKVPGWLVDPEGPLSVRWRHVPRLLPWMLRFIASSREERIGPIADALRALLVQTFDAYAPLVRRAGVPELIRRTGYLVVYESEQAYRDDALAWKIRRDRGVALEVLDADALRKMEPALRDVYSRAVFLPEQGYVANPLRLTRSLARQFQQEGGTVLQREILDVRVGPDGPSELVTEAGTLQVGTLVLCAGVHSAAFSRKLGDRVPLESQRGYHATFEEPAVTLQRPVMSGEGKFFATPMETGLRFAGGVEFAGDRAPPRYARADVLVKHAQRMIPGLSAMRVTQWMGHRPSTPDSLPVIGRSSRFANVFYAFGHGHVGLCGAAPTAKIIADLVADRKPAIDIRPYRADRFYR